MSDETPLRTELQRFIHKHKYARVLDNGALETWAETVDRCTDQLFAGHHNNELIMAYKPVVRRAIYQLKVMPSMRMMQMAGPACEADNACIYNCSYLEINCLEAFDRLKYLSMCGCGVGFSVERRCTLKLPGVCSLSRARRGVIVVEDTRRGWALAFREWLSTRWQLGYDYEFDVSKVRPQGAPLRTTGGFASGPEALLDLQRFVRALLLKYHHGDHVTSADCHRICCKIAQIVQCGGVRRSATISLSDFDDLEMRHIKNWKINKDYADGKEPYLNYANNSAVYTGSSPPADFDAEWQQMWDCGSGERGIVSRFAMMYKTQNMSVNWGTNPCCEIILRPNEFCNLSAAVVRPDDDFAVLQEKVRIAALIGTLQACFTKFDESVLGGEWRRNCEEERLLGVSLNGMQQNKYTRSDPSGTDRLAELKRTVFVANQYFASVLGIRPAARATCVKPHGTDALLCDVPSGIHDAYDRYYERTIRLHEDCAEIPFLLASGYKLEREQLANSRNWVVYFYCQTNSETPLRDSTTAVGQLQRWLDVYYAWCDHKPSITVYVKPIEIEAVKSWVKHNFMHMSGVSFAPYSDLNYPQLPFRGITRKEYHEETAAIRPLDWSKFVPGVRSYGSACEGPTCMKPV